MDSKRYDQNIETDSFDRELFSELEATSEELRNLIERGSHLLPNFRSLILDLFASFYKYNVMVHPEDEVKRGVFMGRKLIEKALSSEGYKDLREETILNDFKSAIATLTLGREVIKWVKSEDGLSEKSLIKEWELEKTEEDFDELKEKLETFEEIEKKKTLGKSLKEAKKDMQFKLRNEEGELKELENEQKERLGRIDLKLQNLVQSNLKKAQERVEEVERELLEWGASMGTPEEKPIGERLELAEKLFKNEKVRRLSLMVGSLKEEMFSSRRKIWSKRGTEVYDISLGNDIGRIIPSELVSLRHRALRKEFLKRLVEERLLQYNLKEEKGRGPLIVCLDGSSSMEGEKEMWAKAVCLSLLEIARRQRRKFVVIVFSSKGNPLKIFGSGLKENWRIKEKDIIELAEYFPGGGTDFEDPLNKALEYLQESRFKRGDVIFVTDGECDVTDEWLKAFLQEKFKLNFQVFSVLIDLTGRETVVSLKKFSDKITTISNLTSKDAKGIFLNLD